LEKKVKSTYTPEFEEQDPDDENHNLGTSLVLFSSTYLTDVGGDELYYSYY
jgi:hypothetical protein